MPYTGYNTLHKYNLTFFTKVESDKNSTLPLQVFVETDEVTAEAERTVNPDKTQIKAKKSVAALP